MFSELSSSAKSTEDNIAIAHPENEDTNSFGKQTSLKLNSKKVTHISMLKCTFLCCYHLAGFDAWAQLMVNRNDMAVKKKFSSINHFGGMSLT